MLDYGAKIVSRFALSSSPVKEGVIAGNDRRRCASPLSQEVAFTTGRCLLRRNVGSSQCLSEELRLEDLGEEAVAQDVINTANQVAVPLRQVAPQKMFNQAFQLGIETFRIPWLRINDLLVDVHHIGILEGCKASVHLVD